MERRLASASICLAFSFSSFSYAQVKEPAGGGEAPICSTEKVNGDCTLNIDRSYPIALPTLQMQPGKRITVNVINPLPFETLTLDPLSAQMIPGTDQAAGFINAVAPDLKGLSLISKSTMETLKLDSGRTMRTIPE